MGRTSKGTARVTETQIRRLRVEARDAGDLGQVHICNIALGELDPVTTADEFESRYGSCGLSASELAVIFTCDSQETAWRACTRVISDAKAQEGT